MTKSVSIDLQAGSINLSKFIESLPEKIKHGMRRGLYISGNSLTKDVRTRMTSRNKSGRVYKIYKGIGGKRLKVARRHTASAPGEYPSVISGDLRKSVDFKVMGSTRMRFGAGNSQVDYAKRLEEGSGRLKPRRYLQQTVRRFQNEIKDNINREISKSIHR